MKFHVHRRSLGSCILVMLLLLMQSVSSTALAQASIEHNRAEAVLPVVEQSASNAARQVNVRSEIPFKKEPNAAPENLANIAAGFGLVLLVLAALVFYFNMQNRRSAGYGVWKRKDSPTVGENKLLVKKRIALTSKNTLHVVEWNGTEYLLACTDQSTNLIATNGGGERSSTETRSSEHP